MSSEQLKAHIQPSFLDTAKLAQCLLAAKQLLTLVALTLEGQRLQRNRTQRNYPNFNISNRYLENNLNEDCQNGHYLMRQKKYHEHAEFVLVLKIV